MVGLADAPAWRLCGWHLLLGGVVALTFAREVCSSETPENKGERTNNEWLSPLSTENDNSNAGGVQSSSETLPDLTSGYAAFLPEPGAPRGSRGGEVAGSEQPADSGTSTDAATSSIDAAQLVQNPLAAGVQGDGGFAAPERPTGTVRPRRPSSIASRLRSWLRRCVPRSDNPQAAQRTPFGLNRHLLLFTYWLITALTTGTLYGWGALSALFVSQGAYSALCPSTRGNETYEHVRALPETLQPCAEQARAVGTLFSLGCALNCAMCTVAGVVFNRFGPRVTGTVGQTLHLLGWVFLNNISSHNMSLEMPAIALLGISIHFNLFSVLTVRALFPGFENSVVMLFGAAFMLSTVMPQVLRSGSNLSGLDVTQSIWIYIAAILFPSLALATLLLPTRDFVNLNTDDPRALGEETTLQSRRTARQDEGEAGRGGNRTVSISSRIRRVVRGILFPQLASLRFMVITTYRVVCNVAAAFYQQSAGLMLSPAAARSFSYVLPVAGCISCLAMGAAASQFSTVPLMAVVTGAAMLMYALPLLSSGISTHYLSAVFASLFIACFSSQHLSVVETIFGHRLFPVLAGWSVMISGILGAASSFLYGCVTLVLLGGDTTPVSSAILAVLCMQYIWLFLLWRYTRRARTMRAERRPDSGAGDIVVAEEGKDGAQFSSEDEDE